MCRQPLPVFIRLILRRRFMIERTPQAWPEPLILEPQRDRLFSPLVCDLQGD
jgi:hypothetical protein